MINKPKGTIDYFDQDLSKLETVFDVLEKFALSYGYKKIILPVFEEKNLFQISVGKDSEIVSKEMFLLQNKGDKENSLVLRPEGTAPTVRFVLENKLIEKYGSFKLYYLDKMYRYERPQKGRFREFYQFGLEIFGDNSIYSELELILFAKDILKKLQVEKYVLEVNSIGTTIERNKFKVDLKKYLTKHISNLSPESKIRIKSNIFRVLDSKDTRDLKVIKDAPKIYDYLSKKQQEHFNELLQKLQDLKITFKINYHLVRGLDYYNDLVFEFVSSDTSKLGSKATIIAGGRYDNLVTSISSTKKSDALGLAVGVERLVMAASNYLGNLNFETVGKMAVIPVSEKYFFDAFKLNSKLRSNNFFSVLDVSSRKLGKKIESYLKQNFRFLIIVGDEILKQKVILKDLSKSNHQVEIDLKNLNTTLRKYLN